MTREGDITSVYNELSLFSRRARAVSSSAHPDLSLVAYTLLSHLATNPGDRATELARHYALEKSTVSRQLAGLELLGLISRTGGGRAGQPITVTSKGTTALRDASASIQRIVASQVTDWSDDELAEFAKLLARFNQG